MRRCACGGEGLWCACKVWGESHDGENEGVGLDKDESMKAKGLMNLVMGMLAAVLIVGSANAKQSASEGKDGKIYERWFVVKIGGQRSGWSVNRLELVDGVYVTTNESEFKMKRGPMPIRFKTKNVVREDKDYQLVSAESRSDMGLMVMDMSYEFGSDGVVVTSKQGGRESKQKFGALDKDVLGPAGIDKLIEEAIANGDRKIAFKSVDFMRGLNVVGSEFTKVKTGNIEVVGKTVLASEWDIKLSMFPGMINKGYFDEKGRQVMMSSPMGAGLDMLMVEADKDLALAEFDAPELMAKTLLKPAKGSKSMGDARGIRKGIYELTFKKENEDVVIDLPRTGMQKVMWGNERKVRVFVNLDEANNPVDDLPVAEDRADSPMLGWKDEKVMALVRCALGDDLGKGMSDKQKASKLRKFVSGFINKKSLGVGFASASEVARTREGDCTEHAMLLAAMMRGAGMPSRVVTGVMYVDEFLGQEGVFGYHAWASCWVNDKDGGRWEDYDAMLKGVDFDGSHIALVSSSMGNGAMGNDMVKLVPIMGNMAIKVINVSR